MKNNKLNTGIILALVFILLIIVDLDKQFSNSILYLNLKTNIKFIINVLNKSLPILVIGFIYISYKLLSSRWIFRIEKFNLGGMSVICSNPDDLFKQQIRNFLNTKRTLFKIDEDRDNFYETIDSYYQVYSFIRDEIKIYDNKSYKDTSTCYKTANQMLEKLNKFLTNNQNNYKRWYKYIIENNMEYIHDKDIKDIQMEYRHYEKIVADFKELNQFFCSVSNEFDIDSEKWN